MTWRVPSRELMQRALDNLAETMGKPLSPEIIAEAWRLFDHEVAEYWKSRPAAVTLTDGETTGTLIGPADKIADIVRPEAVREPWLPPSDIDPAI